MNIYTSHDIKRLEQHTVKRQNIEYIDLMERANNEFSRWFLKKVDYDPGKILVVAGPGNNGGDAIGVAGTLNRKGYNVSLLAVNLGANRSELCQKQLNEYSEELEMQEWSPDDEIPAALNAESIIEGLFGYGLNRPIEGDLQTFVKYLNNLDSVIYSVDIPSGIYADMKESGYSFHADYTLSFHSPKPSFFLAENAEALGRWESTGIGLSEGKFKAEEELYEFFTEGQGTKIIPRRNTFDHKGTYGSVLLISGQRGMAGCATLAGEACLRTGTGKLTIHCPSGIYQILQNGLPEAMISEDCSRDSVSSLPELEGFDAIAVGPGIGTGAKTEEFLKNLFAKAKVPLIIDADALNIMSRWKNWQKSLKKGDIILPHPGEYDRLYGTHKTHLDRINTLISESKKVPFTIVLKGAYTAIGQKGKNISFNSTGNPGMGTAGSGDVLTGVIVSLVGQGLSSHDAARLGVFLHGRAGDIVAEKNGMASLIARDIIHNIGKSIMSVEKGVSSPFATD